MMALLLPTKSPTADSITANVGLVEYVTLRVAGQLFGLPIRVVHEVFTPQHLARVPRAPSVIKGLLNLRGRVVTALCLREILGLPSAAEGTSTMAISVESRGEPFALLIDEIGDVKRLAPSALEANPMHLTPAWQALSLGVYRLDDVLLVVLDLDALTIATANAA